MGRRLSLPEGADRKAGLQARLEAKLLELDAHMQAIQERRAVIVELIEEVRDLLGT